MVKPLGAITASKPNFYYIVYDDLSKLQITLLLIYMKIHYLEIVLLL